jgi:methionine synthase II (cobalamin-independent)
MASEDRILTSHVGSLPRAPELIAALGRRQDGDGPADFEPLVARAVAEIVQRQVAAGLDIVNDGEASKPSYSTYIQERLTGFGEIDAARLPRERHREREEFRDYYAKSAGASSPASGPSPCVTATASSATSPIWRARSGRAGRSPAS